MNEIHVKPKLLIVAFLAAILVSCGITYIWAATSTITPTISAGIFPGAPNFTVWKEGSNYFAKNDSGAIVYSGTNFTAAWQYCIDHMQDIYVQLPDPAASWVWAKTGNMFIKDGNFTLDNAVSIPVGSVIRIDGVASNQENINNGMSGGTQIVVTTPDTCFLCGTTYLTLVDVTGTELYLNHIQFLQNVNLTSATMPVLNLDGMARGKLEDVQIVKPANTNPYMDGVGIRCWQYDDTGGYTEWDQVQVVGFSTGLNVSINHWMNRQQGVAKCETGMIWRVVMGDNFYNLHFQEVDFPFYLIGGFGNEQVASIYGLYLEGCGYSATTPKWICADDYQGMVHIYQTNVHACGADLWEWNMGWCWWYEDVFICSDSPDFPAPSQPTGISSNVTFSNGNPQTVLLIVRTNASNTSGISQIYINGKLTYAISGSFYLRPSDHFKIVYANANYPPYVHFTPISAYNYMGNTPLS